jgi:hydroxyacylglutathione hydrolase
MSMKLAENLYAYVWKGNDNNCNSFLFANVLSGNKHLLIDPGHIITPYLREPAFEMLVKEIGGDGLKIEDIGLIVLTHAHPDHVESAAKFKSVSHAPVAMHKDDENAFRMFGGAKADLFLAEGEIRTVPPTSSKLEIIHTPGHSPGEICIYWPQSKALAVGDVVFYRSTGRTDLPGGDQDLLKTSIQKLARLDTEYLLCGHPYNHPGVIQGQKAIKANFDLILDNYF